MTKLKLSQLVAGGGTALSLFYYGALPTFAINLCSGQSANLPGCGGVKLDSVVSSIVNVLLLAAFIIALIFLIIGGIRWILSGGDKEATNKAKDTVTSALIGLVVVLASFVLINVVLMVLTGQNLGSMFSGSNAVIKVN